MEDKVDFFVSCLSFGYSKAIASAFKYCFCVSDLFSDSS